MRMRFCAMMRRPAFSITALMAPVRLRWVASGLRMEKVRSTAMRGPCSAGERRSRAAYSEAPPPAQGMAPRSAGLLLVEGGAQLRVVGTEPARLLQLDAEPALHGRPGEDDVQPALHVRELVKRLALPFPQLHPADAGHIGDRIFAGQEFA